MMKTSFIFLLLGLAAGAYSETCPSYDFFQTCKCEEIKNTGNIEVRCTTHSGYLKDINSIVNNLSGKKDVVIWLEYLYLGDIPSDFFTGIGVKELNINDCELYSLTSEDGKPALTGLEDTLEVLSLHKTTPVSVMQTLKLSHMRRLKYVELYQNTIPELGNDWFAGGPSTLEVLQIEYCGIKKLGDKAFADLANVEFLWLENNRIKEVKRSMFPSSAQALSKIRLDYNDLESLPEDLFTNMPSLSDVFLNNNRIMKLEKRTWEPIWEQLDHFIIEDNPLKCDSHMSWMFDRRKAPNIIYGECETPKSQNRKNLQQFIDSRGAVE